MLQVTNALNLQNKDTAILFFTRTAQHESLHKDFSGIRKTHFNLLAAEHLISQTQKTIRKSHLPFYIFDSNQQLGNTFGEKLGNAIDAIFNLGFEHIITVGNDCPNLSVNHLLSAKKHLENGLNILGQDSHGGAYLIGLNKSSFYKNDFVQLPWETNTLFSALSNLLTNIYLLKNEHDVNYVGDIKTYLENTYFSVTYIFFQNIIASLGVIYQAPKTIIFTKLEAFFFSSKAPPIHY